MIIRLSFFISGCILGCKQYKHLIINIICGAGGSLRLQEGLFHPREQYPPCGNPVRCASWKLVHPISVAECSRQGRIPAVQGRDTLRFGVNPVFRAVIHQEQHDIGRIQHPKGHWSAERMTESDKKRSMWKVKAWELQWHVHSIIPQITASSFTGHTFDLR